MNMLNSNLHDYNDELIHLVVLQALSGNKTNEQLCEEYDLSPETLHDWINGYVSKLTELLSSNKDVDDLVWLENFNASMRNLPDDIGELLSEPDDDEIEESLDRMEMHVIKFEEEYLSANRIPRNHVWRPYRFCVQDIVLGLVVVRHSLKNNNLEVDVCLTSDAPDYEIHSGAKMTLAFLLSEAYKCGGTLEIRFTKNVEAGKVPASICILADYFGISLKDIGRGRITSSEARLLYLELTDFSVQLHGKILDAASDGKLAPESVCFAVNNGIWEKSEVESIILGSHHPDRIFKGESSSEHRLLFQHDLYHSRSAILSGYLEKKLLRRERSDGEYAVDLEDDTRRLEVTFDPVHYGTSYICEDEDLLLPWAGSSYFNTTNKVYPGQELIVLLRARNTGELRRWFKEDFRIASRLSESLNDKIPKPLICILYPKDFDEFVFGVGDEVVNLMAESDISIVVCPETIAAIEMDAINRLSRSRILRQ